ncbi:hypothetical protein EYF80_025584 [Liparis tanakae]|uniref:Uncharacterized protein n=1 Tax=Liparis tanakae TaxID=230148 RepID=A0A4Z2HET1_9TELE|nr:hypothetical protein EYF80_025584 [Liparis tanakae]
MAKSAKSDIYTYEHNQVEGGCSSSFVSEVFAYVETQKRLPLHNAQFIRLASRGDPVSANEKALEAAAAAALDVAAGIGPNCADNLFGRANTGNLRKVTRSIGTE